MKQLEYKSEHVTAYFDSETSIAWIIYQGTLTPAVTNEAYHWLGTSVLPTLSNDISQAACIFDFRAVTDFQSGNIQAARQESRALNQNFDLSNTPVALLATNAYQEGMIRVKIGRAHV